MRRSVLTLLVLASIAFVASSALYALAPRFALDHVTPRLIGGAEAAPALARPVGRILQLLLLGVWAAVLLHAVRAITSERRMAAIGRQRNRPPRAPYTTLAHGPFIVALLAGAVWPWAAVHGSHPVELALAAAMMAASLWAALERRRKRQIGPVFSGTVEVFAGWATVAAYASFGAALTEGMGLSVAMAAVISVLLLMVTVVEVQLRLGGAVAYGMAVIWALIGIAANALTSDLTVSTAAITAIAAIAAVLVREMS